MSYIQKFKNNSHIIEAYEAPENSLDGCEVLLAWYGYGSYCGSSLVIFKKHGVLYEVNGSHCSCFGLEGQWKPEKTSWEALSKRDFYIQDGDYEGWHKAHKKLKELIKNNS